MKQSAVLLACLSLLGTVFIFHLPESYAQSYYYCPIPEIAAFNNKILSQHYEGGSSMGKPTPSVPPFVKNATIFFKSSFYLQANSTQGDSHTLVLYVRYYDNQTNQTIPFVRYFITLYKEDVVTRYIGNYTEPPPQVNWGDIFRSNPGPLTLVIQNETMAEEQYLNNRNSNDPSYDYFKNSTTIEGPNTLVYATNRDGLGALVQDDHTKSIYIKDPDLLSNRTQHITVLVMSACEPGYVGDFAAYPSPTFNYSYIITQQNYTTVPEFPNYSMYVLGMSLVLGILLLARRSSSLNLKNQM